MLLRLARVKISEGKKLPVPPRRRLRRFAGHFAGHIEAVSGVFKCSPMPQRSVQDPGCEALAGVFSPVLSYQKARDLRARFRINVSLMPDE
jgi:hypothetical protein